MQSEKDLDHCHDMHTPNFDMIDCKCSSDLNLRANQHYVKCDFWIKFDQ